MEGSLKVGDHARCSALDSLKLKLELYKSQEICEREVGCEGEVCVGWRESGSGVWRERVVSFDGGERVENFLWKAKPSLMDRNESMTWRKRVNLI